MISTAGNRWSVCADFTHHYYEYDSDNRITNVYTADGFSPSGGKKDGADQDAKYFYYPHGPLARMETGDLKVQGMDYVYTIQGWIKGVNSTVVNPDLDQGRDGNNVPITGITNKFVTRDALSYSLSYFKNDYKAVAPVDNFIASTDNNVSLGNAAKELFNGNIRMMMTTITKPASMGGQSLPLMTAYRYDQLNRIKQMQAYGDINMGQNEWGSGSTTDYPASYQTSLSYDGNGNIIGLIRNGNTENGAPLAMDNLHYYYRTQSGGVYDPAISLPADASNQLDHVTDQVLSTNYNGTDIDNQSSNNYTYDEIGNMKSDVQENINKIEWTVYGKVSKVIRNKVAGVNSPDLEFHYDATGNRTLKLVKPVNNGVLSNQGEWTYTYYVRDAQGNVLATYDRSFENTGGNNWSDNFGVKEHDVYGSSRIGLKESNPALLLSTESFVSTSYTNNEFDRTNNSLTLWSYLQEYKRMAGVKRYEYGNHLGNVLVVTTDRRVPTQDQTNTTLNAFYTADVLSATDYYPFGMGMPERNSSSDVYRYGFNGMEKDDELSGNGNSYTAEYWQYDPRLGRRWNLDPDGVAFWSPYSVFYNMPIKLSDPNGDCPWVLVAVVLVFTSDVLIAPGTQNKEAEARAIERARREHDIGVVTAIIPGSGKVVQQYVTKKMVQKAETEVVKTAEKEVIKQAEKRAAGEAEKKVAEKTAQEAGATAQKQVVKQGESELVKKTQQEAVKKFADPKFASQLERQLVADGQKSIQKTAKSLTEKIAEHTQKLAEAKKTGGFTSSIERELNTFRKQLETIKEFAKEKGIELTNK